VVDESHVTVPQIGGMERGDHARKSVLAEFGFRLPSCIDNRPLKFDEWEAMRPQTVHVSATPGPWEMEQTGGVFVEQVIRPTGLIDPPVEVRPARAQVDDLLGEVRATSLAGYRSLVTVLTKRMAEDLTEYLHENGVRVRYMHSDIDTIERIEILRDLRLGACDVGIGALDMYPQESNCFSCPAAENYTQLGMSSSDYAAGAAAGWRSAGCCLEFSVPYLFSGTHYCAAFSHRSELPPFILKGFSLFSLSQPSTSFREQFVGSMLAPATIYVFLVLILTTLCAGYGAYAIELCTHHHSQFRDLPIL
jgi:hypothetical protein